jgi:acyl-CoA synthetase (NDP forming)
MTIQQTPTVQEDSVRDEHLRCLLAPRSIAVIGASSDPNKLSGRPVDYLRKFRYAGRIIPVNPRQSEIQGLPAFPSVEAVDGDIDLAIIMTPAESVPDALRALGAKRAGAAIVVASGFAELGERGAAMQEELTAAVAESGVRVLGPNCLGVIGFSSGVVATFTPLLAEREDFLAGNVSFVSQSGAVGTFLIDEMRNQHVGQSYYVATGNEADLGVSDVLLGLLDDEATDVLLAYLEGVSSGERFLEAIDEAHRRDIPVVLLKAGRSSAAARAASSHTASLTGDAVVFDGICAQSGVVQVDGQEELIEAAQVFATGRRAGGRHLTVLSESGGAGVLMTDAAVARGLSVEPWEGSWLERLEGLIPSYGSAINPVDLTAHLITDQSNLRHVLDLAAEHPGTDVICLQVGNADSFAQPLLEAIERAYLATDKPMVVVWTGGTGEPRRRLRELGIPCYTDPAHAARALSRLVDYSLRPALPGGGRPVGTEESVAREVVRGARARGATSLNEVEAATVLGAYGIPVVRTSVAASPDEAVVAAACETGPVVMKILSNDIAHKSDIGGVRLGLHGEVEVRSAAEELLRIGREHSPSGDARLVVQPMETGEAELIVGGQVDPVLGPVVVAGLGGVLVEVLGDVAIGRAPSNHAAADRLLRGLRGARILEGVRGRPAVDVASASDVVERVSWLMADLSDVVAEIDVNPLIVRRDGSGAVAVDALIVLPENHPVEKETN